ncbi:helix-turn-helix domain-containing protein [Scytonema sp. PCC 10023]|uniref:helix-turn-helix domain-containing protein n=1 Tax=Scytonema sp. PCC 10023 TaxID=1680591 RepID=UPI0039C668C2
MLTLNYRYRIYPDTAQEQILIEWMDICRGAYNYALREIKDWCLGRKCLVDRCSLEKEYILPPELKFPNEIQQLNNLPKAKKEFPRLGEVPSQVLQQTPLAVAYSVEILSLLEDLAILVSRNMGSSSRCCFLSSRKTQ